MRLPVDYTSFGRWRKSSYSALGNDCVELAWRKSSYSGYESQCIELAYDGVIRDSKNPEGKCIEAPLAGLIAMAKSW